MADYRYLEAWKRNPVAKSNSTSHASVSAGEPAVAAPSGYGFVGSASGQGGAMAGTAKDEGRGKASLNVRLDTPGGVTYSPSDLTPHNVIKRMFIPHTLGSGTYKHVTDAGEDDLAGAAPVLPVGGSKENGFKNGTGDPNSASGKAQEYNFDADLEEEQKDPQISEARKYALSINMDELAGRREGGVAWEDKEREDAYGNDDGDIQPVGSDDAKTTSGLSKMTTASTRTTATMATVNTLKADSSLPDWFTRTSAKKDSSPFVALPSYTKQAKDFKRPWDAMRWHGHRAFERPSMRDQERGIAAFEDVNGPGRAPSIAETTLGRTNSDAASILTSQTSATVKSDIRGLSVADLFVLDPRRSRPLRMVRRTDPRQILLLCNGMYLEPQQVATLKAAQAARDAGLDPSALAQTGSQGSKKAQEMLASISRSAEPRGGIGVVFCPSDDPLHQNEETLQKIDPHFEVNMSRRLEMPPTFAVNSERRAQLRAVVAALEMANWEDEGFDKIVIGVEQAWIVQGITVDIWRWRHIGWKLTELGPQGGPGESVPDRDLWELLDATVRKYEDIDCNVRFWHVAPRDVALAKRLAQTGALKDVPQRNKLVRWRKKPAPALVEAQARREKANKKHAMNHQGPTLAQVH